MRAQENELVISIANVEDLVFQDSKAWKNIPDMKNFRDQWAFSRTSPSLRPTGKAAIMDFLFNAEPRHEEALSIYFGQRVTIDRMDRRTVANIEFDAEKPPELSHMSMFTGFGCFRKEDRVFVTFWR